MTLSELKYIIALAKEKHFGKAAKSCHVSQPTLSIAVNKLESELNTHIFERVHNNIQVTDIGEKIITQAKRTLEEASIIQEIVEAGKHQTDIPLKAGAIFTIAPYLFPLLIPKLHKIAPKMELVIQEDYTINLKEKLCSGELDVAFIALPFEEKGIVTQNLYTEPFVGLMRKDHILSTKKMLSLNDIAKEHILLLGEGHCFRDNIAEICPSCYQGDSSVQTVHGTSLETLRHMVASGMGMTILPCSATQVKYYDSLLCTKPFKEKTPKRTVALAWRASFTRTKAIDAVIKSIKQSDLHGICLTSHV